VVRSYSSTQIILLDEKLSYETRRDEGMKLLGLASWQIDAVAGGEELRQHGDGLFADLMPHVVSDRRTQARLEQRLALLRHVEALRLYAVDHDGGLPRTLAQISVPLPDDPITGKPFVYKLEGATGYLYGSPPRGEEQNPCFNVRYEVTVQN
jgi:hypothetical protein